MKMCNMFLSKILQTRKPDSVSKLSFIWLAHYCDSLAAYPPIFPVGIGRAALKDWLTWHYSM